MTRRHALWRLLTTLQATAIGSLTLGLLTNHYRVVIKAQSTTPTAPVDSSEKFWKLHQHSFADELNSEFLRDGRLLKVNSYLCKDGKSAYLVKLYRQKEDHLEYVRRLEEYHQSISYAQKTFSKVIPV